MTSVAYQIAHRRVLVVEQVLEEWQIEHEKAMLSRDIEELVEETINVLAPLKRLVAGFKVGLNQNTSDKKIIAAHRAGFLLNKALGLFQKIDDLAAGTRRTGEAAGRDSRLDQAMIEIAAIRDAFHKQWMLPDQETVKRAKEEEAAGKFREL
jgi:hypothetical protein